MIKNYLSLIKFSHTIFAMPFALVGMFLGMRDSELAWSNVLLAQVIGAMILARSAAMAFNRYLDADIDTANPRTREVREIPRGVISQQQALVFVMLASLGFVAVTATINRLVLILSPVALLVILGYSYTKRFTALCHVVLGVGLGLAPIGAYLAVTGVFHWVPVLIALAVVTWVSGFDVIYSLQDQSFDRDMGLHSLPVKLGGSRALRLAATLHVSAIVLLALAGYLGHFGWLYGVGWAIFSLMIVRQHRLVTADDLTRVNLAFFTFNGIASLVFGLFAILDLLM